MATTRKFEDLTEQFDKSNCYCLNEDPSFGYNNLFIGDDTLLLKSEADEQLLIHLEFKDAVKIHSISVKAPHDDSAPSMIKLFVNRNNLGFSDVTDIEPTQKLEWTQDQLQTGTPVELRFVKFQRVTSLTIFVEENHGAETSALSSIKLFGESIQGTNMNDLKSQAHDH
ncbi:unnamed protein product [Aphanomyces euteiches]|uniref:PITH domain-containing protein n=1 Tax=Aphanomyces euteiches TaxID=100861 RepID=A0A6G0XIK8_9STRA|nr:hypothetical protein Ae201684_004352 [Aphanomyces euteiches]KAH9093625.1 hypothetical protein Ae201684P_016251 [Aphanomyces euteiches]KAH9136272.1 hypothetical protein AeRB84_018493 [Aphanomyces euteiches]